SLRKWNPTLWVVYNKQIYTSLTILRNCTLILTWDIEKYASQMGEFAEVLEQKNKKDDPKLLKQICLVDVETALDPRWGSGEEVKEKKDYIGAIKIKITAEKDFFSSFLKLPGCVPIDIRVCLKKRYPHSEVEKEGSLKFFLKKCGLNTKADMLYDEMWRIYSEAKKTPLLYLQEKCEKEVASIAHVSLFDSHYRANGMKVRNLLSAYTFKRDMVFSSRVCENIEKEKYPGAYVFPPEKEIETRRPVTGLDFASLYP
ncbi:10515_t:CDS:2, partial [Funneliformis geosporum]